ncbi:MAG: DUF3592 domain-containing protein [Saprospiraceae bacterium]|nr:DUF3592 domain-containing protein [Saprospiraceae bacterium]
MTKYRRKQDFKPQVMQALKWLSMVFLVVAAYGCLKKGWIILAGTSTTGWVTEIRSKSGGFKTTPSYAPVIAYKGAGGYPKVYESNMYSSPARYKVGDKAPLWYWKEWVLLKSISMWTNTIITGVFGLFFVLVGYLTKKKDLRFDH